MNGQEVPNQQEEVIFVGFRRADIRKISEFCIKNKIRVVPMENGKMDWNQLLASVLNSPVICKTIETLDHHMERKAKKEMGEEVEEEGEFDGEYQDVEYQDIPSEEYSQQSDTTKRPWKGRKKNGKSKN